MDVSNHLASDLFVWPSPNDSSVSPNVDPKGFLDRSRPDLYLIHADLESGLDVRVTRRLLYMLPSGSYTDPDRCH